MTEKNIVDGVVKDLTKIKVKLSILNNRTILITDTTGSLIDVLWIFEVFDKWCVGINSVEEIGNGSIYHLAIDTTKVNRKIGRGELVIE
jgi:hypothetical protein